MQPAHLANDVVAGAKMQVVGIRQNHLRSRRPEVVRVKGFDSGQRSDRHERRCLDDAVGRAEHPAPGSAVCGLYEKREGHGTTAIASPYEKNRYSLWTASRYARMTRSWPAKAATSMSRVER